MDTRFEEVFLFE